MPEQAPRSNRSPSLPQVGRAVTVGFVIDETWRVIETMGADGAAVYTVEADGALVRQASFGSLSHLPAAYPPPDGATPTAPTGAPPLNNDRVHWMGLESTAGMVGWLALRLGAFDAFSQGKALQVAADRLASALAAQRVAEALQRAQRQAEMVCSITRLAHRPVVGTDTLSSIVRALVTDGGFLSAVIYRFDAGRVICEARDTAAGEADAEADLERLESVARRAMLTRYAQSEPGPMADVTGAATTERPEMLMAAPLLRDGLALGALAVKVTTLGWRDGDAHFLAILAEPVSIALENVGPRARLYSRLQEKAAYAEAELETVVREAPAGLVVLDEEWRILRLNPAACGILDCEVEVALGQPFVDVVKDARVVEDLAALAASEMSEAHRPMIEARLEERHCDVLMGIARLGPGYLVSVSDITALKDVDRLKSEIISNVSHEFRAPLASIKAYTELLLEQGIGSDEARRQRFLGIIGEEADYLTDLITNMLDLSRLQSGHLQVTYTWLDLRRLIGDVINMLAAQAQARGITFDVAGQPDVLLWADRQLMITILKNLIGNAVKYNRVGGHVRIAVEDGVDEVTVRVRDDGVGIPASAIPQLFEKFYRVVSTTESGIQGTGLGLALTKAAVDAHGGQVAVESREGRGTEFTIRLPKGGPTGK